MNVFQALRAYLYLLWILTDHFTLRSWWHSVNELDGLTVTYLDGHIETVVETPQKFVDLAMKWAKRESAE